MTLEGQVDTGRTTHLPQMHRQVPWKTWVRVATTANGTLASAFENGDTVDGVTLATGDRILLKNQTATEENGIRVVQASGTPARAFDMDEASEVQGAVVLVLAGTANAGTLWYTTSNPTTLGTDAIAFSQFTGGLADLHGIDFLVGTASGLLSGEIVAGTTPGGELGGTWSSPTVDATHSGSPHSDFVAKADDLSISIIADGGSTQPPTGPRASITMPRAGHIRKLQVHSPANVSGACAWDIWKLAYGASPPTVANTIFGGGSTKPNLSASKMYEDSTLTGVTTAFSAGDVFVFNLDSVSTLTLATLVLIFDWT